MNSLFCKRKNLLVFILGLVLFGATNVYAAEAINDVTITGIKEPVVGDKVSDVLSNIKVPEGANYSIIEILWWESENGMYFGNMSDNSIFNENYCYHYSITLEANEGFEFPKNENDEYVGTLSTTDMGYEMAQINNDENLEIIGENIIFGDISYKVIHGANQTVTYGSDAKFVIDADYDLFQDGFVIVDEERVDPSNYTSERGSTIVTLKKEFIESLTEGEHTLYVIFDNYKSAETTFIVAKNNTNNNSTTEITPPNTGINNYVTKTNTQLYVLLLIISAIVFGRIILIKNLK